MSTPAKPSAIEIVRECVGLRTLPYVTGVLPYTAVEIGEALDEVLRLAEEAEKWRILIIDELLASRSLDGRPERQQIRTNMSAMFRSKEP